MFDFTFRAITQIFLAKCMKKLAIVWMPMNKLNVTFDIGCSIELLATQYNIMMLFIYLFVCLLVLEIKYRVSHMQGMHFSIYDLFPTSFPFSVRILGSVNCPGQWNLSLANTGHEIMSFQPQLLKQMGLQMYGNKPGSY